jgi:hypothetical protein
MGGFFVCREVTGNPLPEESFFSINYQLQQHNKLFVAVRAG